MTVRGADRARQLIDHYDWPRGDRVASRGQWALYTYDVFDYLAVWVDAENTRMAVSNDTWAMLACDEMAIAAFFTDMTGGVAGMKFIVADAGPYAAAARKQAQLDGPAEAVNPVAAIIASANYLVLQASSMNRTPTALQQGIFAERYAKARADLAAVELQMETARAALDLAGTVLYDATQ